MRRVRRAGPGLQRRLPLPGARVSERHSLIDTITDSIVPVHSDGYKFLAIGAGVCLLLFLVWPPLAWVAVLITAWIAYFFRDPAARHAAARGPDHRARRRPHRAIERVRPPAELGLGDEPARQVSIFLSVFDVHINRAPVAGPHRPLDLRAGQLPQRRPRQGERGERAALPRHRHARRHRDRGRADRRPDRAAHRNLHPRGRYRRRRRALSV